MKFSRSLFFLLAVAALAWAGWQKAERPENTQNLSEGVAIQTPLSPEISAPPAPQSEAQETDALPNTQETQEAKTPKTQAPEAQKVVQDVPFLSQAPSAQWDDPIFQDGCEEASLLMAYAWSSGEPLPSQAQAEQKIRELSALAEKKFGPGVYDTSAEDTAQIFREYFKSQAITVQYDIALEDIHQALNDNKLVIVPANGQKLGNPNFTQPGPEHHMLVVIGYDPETEEFITNDPGTRRGASYRYPRETLFAAIRDYPTGHHESSSEETKTLLIVSKFPK
jgi:hypothetical protein